MLPEVGSLSENMKSIIGPDSTAIPTIQGKATIRINLVAALIWVCTFSMSPDLKAVVRVGTADAAMAEAMEMGTFMSTLYSPVYTPHHSEMVFAS